jgi:ABC-2 type transport system permease protein
MTGTLIRLHLRRHRLLFLLLPILVVAHEWLFLYIYQFWREQTQFADILLKWVPDAVRESIGIPLTDLTGPPTFKALIFLRPDFRILTMLFGIVVGTDAIAGEVGRGTSDLIFSHPVRRSTAVNAAAAATAAHLCLIGCAMVFGFLTATRVFPMGDRQPELMAVLPCMALVLLSSFVISLVALMVGSLAPNRPRAVGISLLLIIGPIMLGFVANFSRPVQWFAHLFPENYYKPHLLLIGGSELYGAGNWFALAGIGLVAYLGARYFAERRDLVA